MKCIISAKINFKRCIILIVFALFRIEKNNGCKGYIKIISRIYLKSNWMNTYRKYWSIWKA